MKLDTWFAEELVRRTQDVADMHVRLCDIRRQETHSEEQEARREAAENTILSEMLQAFGMWAIASQAFLDRATSEILQPPDSEESSDDPPWDF